MKGSIRPALVVRDELLGVLGSRKDEGHEGLVVLRRCGDAGASREVLRKTPR